MPNICKHVLSFHSFLSTGAYPSDSDIGLMKAEILALQSARCFCSDDWQM